MKDEKNSIVFDVVANVGIGSIFGVGISTAAETVVASMARKKLSLPSLERTLISSMLTVPVSIGVMFLGDRSR